jgi:hypothetical protein
MMPNFQPTPHECDLPAPEGVPSDLEGCASLSRGGGAESGLGGLTWGPSCKVHGPGKHIAPDGPGKNRPLICLECMNEAHHPWRVTIRELRAEVAALQGEIKTCRPPGGPLKPLGEMLSRAESIRLLESGPPLGMPHCGADVEQREGGEVMSDVCNGTGWESGELKAPTLAECCGQPPGLVRDGEKLLVMCTACARTVGGPVGTVAGAWGVLVGG